MWRILTAAGSASLPVGLPVLGSTSTPRWISETSRCGPGARYWATTASLSLVRSDVAPERLAVVAEVDAGVLDLVKVGRVDDRRDDVRHAPDPVRAVGALDHGGRRVLRGGHQRLDERRVERRVLVDEADVPALVLRAVGRHRLGDRLPVLAGPQVGERLVGLRLGGRLLRVGGLRLAVGELGRHGDHPRVTQLGRGRVLGQPRVDVGVADRDVLRRASWAMTAPSISCSSEIVAFCWLRWSRTACRACASAVRR